MFLICYTCLCSIVIPFQLYFENGRKQDNLTEQMTFYQDNMTADILFNNKIKNI